MDIPDIQIVCQWRAMLPSISMIWQRFGQCVRDPTLQGFVYLLIEKEHFDAKHKRVEMAKDSRKQKQAATVSRATKSSHACAGISAEQVARPDDLSSDEEEGGQTKSAHKTKNSKKNKIDPAVDNVINADE